ncbi:MAG: hypothetical protein ACO1RX_22870 [Candidatus Sericytochromatia bacterium]
MITSKLVIALSDWTYRPSLEKTLLFLQALYDAQLVTFNQDYLEPAKRRSDPLDRTARYKPYPCTFESLIGHPVSRLQDLKDQETEFIDRLQDCPGETESIEFHLRDTDAVRSISNHMNSREPLSAIDFRIFNLERSFSESIEQILNPGNEYNFYVFHGGELWVQLGFSCWTILYFTENPEGRKGFRQLYPELNYPSPDTEQPFMLNLISYMGNFSLSIAFAHTIMDESMPEVLAKLQQSPLFQTLQNLMRGILLQDRPDIEIQLRWATECWPE